MITIDASELRELSKSLAKYQAIVPRSVEQSALRRSVRPIFNAARQEVPVGRVVSDGGIKGPDYRRGGATRKDLRVKNRRPGRGATSSVWVGPSFGPGKVGWRNHFITGGVQRAGRGRNVNIKPNNYLQRAYNRGIGESTKAFASEINESFLRWAKKNLPKGSF